MYCPTCSSHNQDGLKYCTRCGTNLGVVSEALSGKLNSTTEMDERLIELLKNYYRGRRMTVLGFILSALIIFKLAVSLFFGMTENYLPLVVILGAFFIVGLVWFVWGAMKWNNSSSELKALGYDNPKSVRAQAKQSPASLPESSTVMTMKDSHEDLLHTDPLAPPSVTEQTTRFLEDETPASPPRVSN